MLAVSGVLECFIHLPSLGWSFCLCLKWRAADYWGLMLSGQLLRPLGSDREVGQQRCVSVVALGDLGGLNF